MKIVKPNTDGYDLSNRPERRGIAEFLLEKLTGYEREKSILRDESAMLSELRSGKWKKGGRWGASINSPHCL